MQRFTVKDIPSQAGRVAVVTGPTINGLGYETALALAGKGAAVVLAGRSAEKLAASRAAILNAHGDAQVEMQKLDLASLASVHAAADAIAAAHPRIDLLINNAGVMALRERATTADGFEMQFGCNHLGHFALTGLLLAQLKAARGRVVNVSSLAHRNGKMRFDDLQSATRYHPWAAYCQSKLANLLFTFELERRSAAHGWGVSAAAAHPGYARTELIPNGPGDMGFLARALGGVLSHSPADGALPTLVAATAPFAKGGDYYGPNGFYELKGPPAPARVMPQAREEGSARRLWDQSEELTGVRFAQGA